MLWKGSSLGRFGVLKELKYAIGSSVASDEDSKGGVAARLCGVGGGAEARLFFVERLLGMISYYY